MEGLYRVERVGVERFVAPGGEDLLRYVAVVDLHHEHGVLVRLEHEAVGVLNVDLLRGQHLHQAVQSPGVVLDENGHHLLQLHGKSFFREDLVGALGLVDDKVEKAVVAERAYRDRAQVDLLLREYGGHPGEHAGFVFGGDGELMGKHGNHLCF